MVNERLESWVEEQLEQGSNLSQIEQKARDLGWSEKDISEAEEVAQRKVNEEEPQNSEGSDNSQPSGIGRRGIAYLIDAISVFVIGVALGLIFSMISLLLSFTVGFMSLAAAGANGVFALVALMPLTYFILLEAKYGKTIGKEIMNLKVVREDGSKIGGKESIIRNLLRVIDEAVSFFLVAIVSMALSDKNQRVGDRAANTMVVQQE